ncbi:MAG: tail fiber protein [Verrucomicrobiota bacterium]
MKSTSILLTICLALSSLLMLDEAHGSEPLLGEIRMFAGNFAPRGWAFCEGQSIQISENAALFSLLGTTYGGDGRQTFALPDLRGRAPIHAGIPLGMLEVKQGAQSGNVGVVPSGKMEGPTTTATLAVKFIIALEGEFPGR